MVQSILEQNNPPDVRKFKTASAFLKAVFAYKSKLDNRFNLEIWSIEMGFKSRSFMYMLYHEKRQLTIPVAKLLSQSLNHTPAEQEHFLKLVLLQRSDTNEEKEMINNLIYESISLDEAHLNKNDYAEFLSSPLNPLLKLLLAFADVEGSLEQLSSLLNLENEKVQNGLQILEKLNLAEKTQNENGQTIWKTKSKTFRVSEEDKGEALNQFHEKTQFEALEVLKDQSSNFKKFTSIYFCVSKSDEAQLAEEMEMFLNKMKAKYGTDYLDQKELIKLNLSTYAVTNVHQANPSADGEA